jgi:aminoglycoside phosphotransferase (APT) family kinase protein
MSEPRNTQQTADIPSSLESARDRYSVVRALGKGGFGVTHLARRASDGEQVVIKRLRMDRLEDWKAFDLFEREAKVLEALEHPNIPAFVDHFKVEDGGTLRGFALVQTYVEGRTLAELQAERPSGERLRGWLVGLLEVCEYLHTQSPPVIHRDISPKNVMIRPDDEPVLIDFGTVQNAVRSADTVASTAAGTFGYAAPEQLLGRASAASDLYGLAMTYLAVATGKEPETLAYRGNHVDVSAALEGHDTHPRVALLLEEMTDPDASRRPASAADVLARLQRIPRTVSVVEPVQAPLDMADPTSRVEAKWRARMRRVAAVGDRAAKAPKVPELEGFACCGLSETGAYGVVLLSLGEGGVASIDLDTFALTRLRNDKEPLTIPDIVVDFEGRCALLKAFDRGFVFVLNRSGEAAVCDVTLPSLHFTGEAGSIALSPDGKTLACLGHREVVLADLRKGTAVKTLAIESGFSRGIRFSPDGRVLVLPRYSTTTLLGPSGQSEEVDGDLVAANDGRKAALVRNETLYLGEVTSWAPFAWKDKPRKVCSLEGDVSRARFSPDDRRVLCIRDGYVDVVELETGRVLLTAGHPFRAGAPLPSVEDVGVSGDGRRLFVYGDCSPHPLATDNECALAVYSLTRTEPLGVLTRVSDSDTLYGATTFGLQGKLNRKKKGRKVCRLLMGEDPEHVLEAESEVALDYGDRAAFWGAQVADGLVPPMQDLGVLIEASAGLTHVLPVAVTRAKQAASETPASFTEDVSGVGGLVDALAWLRGKSEAEREVLFEDMLAELRVAPQQASAPGTRVPWVVLVAIVAAALVGVWAFAT